MIRSNMPYHFARRWDGIMASKEQIDAELARRYRWCCEIGWKEPVLNHPIVILGKASPADIDILICKGIKRWPSKEHHTPTPSSTLPPREVA